MLRPRLHRPTITGRIRSEPGLLVLIGLVVALTTALTSAVAPMTERTADKAVAASVRDAGPRGAVVATMPRGYDDPRGDERDPSSAVELGQDADYARSVLPAELADVLGTALSTLSTPALQLLDEGPGRRLRLVYVAAPDPPAVTWTAGGAPQASVGDDEARVTVPSSGDPWPVQVGLSEAAAAALGLGPGDRVLAEDEQHRRVEIRVSGVYAPDDPGSGGWQGNPELLHPIQGVSDGIPRVLAAALVSPASLPDLRVGVPADDLVQRVAFPPRPEQLSWQRSAGLGQAIASLKTSPGLARGDISWDSQLDRVVSDARGQVASARGQAQVLLVGLLACALLLLVLAAQLLVHRRSDSLAGSRERGATLLGIGLELLVEALGVAVAGVAAGLTLTGLLTGGAGWTWAVPVLVVAALAAPALGALVAARSTDSRRVPANRRSRRTAARRRQFSRLAVEGAVVAAAALSFVALRQRGVVGTGADGGDLTAAGAATWCTVAGALVVLRLLPSALRLWLRAARRSTGGSGFFVAARLTQAGTRGLPLLVVSLAVAQLTVAAAIAATEQRGQAEGALLSVGGDARLTAAPDRALEALSDSVADDPGVRSAVAGRVADGIRASSRLTAAPVRLVVVDAVAYERLLADSDLPDAPALAQLDEADGVRVPALLSGGDPALRDELVVRWEDVTIPLEVVGTGPRVDASVDPVVVVDAAAFVAAGASADPDTVWAVGAGAATALESVADSSGSVITYAEVLDARRDAPLPSALVRLAVACSVLLLLFALLAVVLSGASEAPRRRQSLGRLRSLGVGDRPLGRVLAGELGAPVAIAVLVGLLLGAGCALTMTGSLSLERVTGQTESPEVVLPWWPLLAGAVLLAGVMAVAWVERRRLRRVVLAQLLRS